MGQQTEKETADLQTQFPIRAIENSTRMPAFNTDVNFVLPLWQYRNNTNEATQHDSFS
jgi:hypothetical protein